MTDDLVKRVDSLIVLLDMERKKSLSLGKHIEKLEEEIGVLFAANVRLNSRADIDSDGYVDRIEKLEASLLWYAEHCQKGGDDIEGPYGDYGEIARKALEGKDD